MANDDNSTPGPDGLTSQSSAELKTVRDSAANALFAGLPKEPLARVQAVSDIYALLRPHATQILTSAISELLNQTKKPLPEAEATKLTTAVSCALADTRLAIRNPLSGLPASLVAVKPSADATARYLRLTDSRRSAAGRRISGIFDPETIDRRRIELIEEASMARHRDR